MQENGHSTRITSPTQHLGTVEGTVQALSKTNIQRIRENPSDDSRHVDHIVYKWPKRLERKIRGSSSNLLATTCSGTALRLAAFSRCAEGYTCTTIRNPLPVFAKSTD